MTFVRIFLIATLCLYAHLATAKQDSILIMGDSLSAGYGIKLEDGWVNLLQQDLKKKYQVSVINASVSGETSSGGLSRLPALLGQHKPTIVLIELGGNDGLRGQSIKLMKENLQKMINLSKNINAKVVLAGIQIPTNYGSRYTTQFKQSFEDLANENDVALIPFLLEGIATQKELMQNDGIHPTAAAQPLIVNNVSPIIQPLLR